MGTIIAPLTHARFPGDVALDQRTFIKRNTSFVKDALGKAVNLGYVRHPFDSSFHLQINAEYNDTARARAEVEEVVLRLRLFKSGGVGFSQTMQFEDDLSQTKDGDEVKMNLAAVFFYQVWDRPGLPAHFEIEQEELESLKSFFMVCHQAKLMDKTAYRYFFRGYHEPYGIDRFLDNVISLENILVNDQKDISNIRYKFADRGAFLLRKALPNDGGAHVFAERLKDMYDKRSSIVHAAKKQIGDMNSEQEQQLLIDSDSYCRALLNLLTTKPEFERAEGIDNAKFTMY